MTFHMRDLPPAGHSSSFADDRRGTHTKSLYETRVKRWVDLAFVFAALVTVGVILVPLLAIMLLLVARDGHNPIYKQRRIGRDGRIFSIYKIRTMVHDADQRLDDYLGANPECRAEWDAHQKLAFDPRITRVGRFLRKSSLDELPQLWNVVRGDMSLVGPRPMMVHQKALYPGRAYYEMRPGITGPWQVSDRNRSTFAERANFDADYHYRLSFLTDMNILRKTVSVVLRGTGC